MSMTKLNDDALEQVSGGTILRYLVRSGDTVKSIADMYHVTEEQLVKWNHIKDPDVIKVGQQIKIMY